MLISSKLHFPVRCPETNHQLISQPLTKTSYIFLFFFFHWISTQRVNKMQNESEKRQLQRNIITWAHTDCDYIAFTDIARCKFQFSYRSWARYATSYAFVDTLGRSQIRFYGVKYGLSTHYQHTHRKFSFLSTVEYSYEKKSEAICIDEPYHRRALVTPPIYSMYPLSRRLCVHIIFCYSFLLNLYIMCTTNAPAIFCLLPFSLSLFLFSCFAFGSIAFK